MIRRGPQGYQLERQRRSTRRRIRSRRSTAVQFGEYVELVRTYKGERLRDRKTGEVYWDGHIPLSIVLKVFYPASAIEKVMFTPSPMLALLPRDAPFFGVDRTFV